MSVLSRAFGRLPARRAQEQSRRVRRHALMRLETLEGRLLLHGGAGGVVEDAEHLAVFGSRDATTGVVTGGLVPDSSVTDKSIASGHWSDATNWSHGVPHDGDNLLISSGTIITLDGNESVDSLGNRVAIKTIRVDGTLAFDTHANTTLLVDSIIVEPSGSYQMGTAQSPIDPNDRARVIFADLAKPLDDALAQAAPGTAAAQAAQKAVDDYDTARTAWDPLQFGLGLVSHGAVQIYGSRPDNTNPGAAAGAVTSWVQGMQDPANPAQTVSWLAGSSVLDLGVDGTPQHQPISVPTSWKVGDAIIVTGKAAARPYYLGGAFSQDEEVRITAINGGKVTISAPLQYNHDGGATYIADAVRNATFESEDPGVVERRGHIMFMHNPNVAVDAAGFYGLGRTDKRRPIDDPVVTADLDNPGLHTTDVLMAAPNPDLVGKIVTLWDGTVINNGVIYAADGTTVLVHVEHRVLASISDPAAGKSNLQIARTGLNPRGRYAVHFHRTGDTTPVSIADSAVVDSPGWGIVNHSSNVDVEDNLVFDAVGAGFVTEAGDEVGTFNRNIAIKSLGSGQDVDARRSIQDFGHDGDGFWFQGGNVTVTNNVASSQRHAGFVFFPRGLVQKGFTPPQTTIPGDTLPSADGAEPKLEYSVADIPLRTFSGNVAFASASGYESWFSLQSTTLNVRTVIDHFKVFDVTGDAIFTPYTSRNTFSQVSVSSPVDWAGQPAGFISTGFARNDRTAGIIYDHVNAQGFRIGINAPVVGTSSIIGGVFNNLQNITVTTTDSDTRVLNVNDASPSDPVVFLDNLKTVVNGHSIPAKQYDIYLQANWMPLFNDITRNFSKDVIKIGLVSHNGQQVYYKEQAYDFVPYPSATWLAQNPTSTKHGPLVAAWVPVELQDQTNAQLYAQYGLAIGGVVAPVNAIPDPLINGIVGPAAQYTPTTYLFSQKWFDDRKGSYYPIYSYWNPSQNGGQGGYIYVDEGRTDAQGHHLFAASPLHGGWNVIQRSFTYLASDGQTTITKPVSLLVYNENQDPTFIQANPGQVLNIADVNNGATFNLTGWISASYGKVRFTATVKLNDAKYVSALKTRADGTKFITISFNIQNFAGTVTKISIDFNVTTSATLIKDSGQVYLPYLDLSTTLKRLLGLIP